MGKIIEFRRREEKENEPEGVRLYFQCFKALSKSEQYQVEEMVKNAIYKGMLQKLTDEQILEIYGYTAAKYKNEYERAITEFNKKLRELLEKHGNEVVGYAKSN